LPENSYLNWAASWAAPASYGGAIVPDVDARISKIVHLWNAPVPDGWQREHDPQLLDPARRYRRGDIAAPTPGSEHELELQILRPDPEIEVTTVLGERLIDGINAIPLARDPEGRRSGNVEADLLLLTSAPGGARQLLVEAKTTWGNAWYAAVENLRQLKLFQLSQAANEIFRHRGTHSGGRLSTAGMVLAPASFYTARGAKRNALEPARQLIAALDVPLHLATWDPAQRQIGPAP
jgi:hypothetical protein